MGRHRSGLVVTGGESLVVARRLLAQGCAEPILCDADRYGGGRLRLRAGVGLRRGWTNRQHDLGLVALTDSGYLSAGDWPGLHRLLDDAATHEPPVIVMLPLAADWFAVPAWVHRLVTTVDEARLPVAVAVEHDGVPFAVRHVLLGLLRLLTASVPVLLLRSDLSALGAVCHGAHAGAISDRVTPLTSALLGGLRPPDSEDDVLDAQLAVADLLLRDPAAMSGSWHALCARAHAGNDDLADLAPLLHWLDVAAPHAEHRIPVQNADEDAPRRPPSRWRAR